MKRIYLTLSPLAFLLSLPVNASGLFLNEAVYANQGTAGAGDGVYTDSAAAIWVNPAIMSFMEGNKTTVNGLIFDLDVDYVHDGDPSKNGNSRHYLGSVSGFHVQQLSDDWHLGLAIATAGGSGLDFGYNWAGGLQLENINLLTMQINPSLSYRINDKWSVAAGAQINYALLDARMVLSDMEQDSDWAFGWNIGTVYKPTDELTLGLSYRSKLEHDFNGNIHSDINIIPGGGELITLNRYGMDTSLVAIADFSARYQVNDKFALMTTLQWHQWSDWDETPMTFSGRIGGEQMGRNVHLDLTQPRDWDDVWHYGIGAEYALNQDWTFKVGFSYETSPQDDPYLQTPDIPVGSQKRYSIGVATKIGDSTLDMFYEYADFGKTEIRQDRPETLFQPYLLNGYFEGHIHFVGFAIIF